MRFYKSLILIAIATSLLVPMACSTHTQTPHTSTSASTSPTSPTPEELVVGYAAKLPAGDYMGFAQDVDPEELEKFRSTLLPLYEMAEQAEHGADFMEVFAKGRSLDEIRSASAAEFLAIFLESLMQIDPTVAEALGGLEMKPIGTVWEQTPDGEVAHVMVRAKTSAAGVEMEQIDTISMRQSDGTWKMMLSAQIKGVADAIAAQLAAGDMAP